MDGVWGDFDSWYNINGSLVRGHNFQSEMGSVQTDVQGARIYTHWW